MRPSRICLPAVALALAACGRGPTTPAPSEEPAIVPRPAELEYTGRTVTLGPDVVVSLTGPGSELLAPALDAWTREQTDRFGIAFRPASADEEADLVLTVESVSEAPPEGYTLEVEGERARLAASDPAGLFYALRTLGQLQRRGEAPGTWTLPEIRIDDMPRFRYRGMHLDVGRHFFPVDFVKRFIDLMARYKYNRFHWHLTEDQGWRIQIDAYPRLTEVGACRAETQVEKNFDPFVGDGRQYCGYYTKEEIREVVAYAAERFVTVIPEIEMPGHSVAALAAYPELSCTGGPFEVSTMWGVKEDIYCPSEETFAFLETVLDEVLELFPSEYIHIGGDEAPKKRWEESELAQAVIDREGLADEHELQSYFIRRIERFLTSRNRRLIGWDEILEGGLAPEATVMSWRGMDGGIEAARQGHDVVMTPTSHVYFDYYQADPEGEPLAIGGLTPLDKVYGFEPVPPELTADEAGHVLGGQANVWTEYIATPEHAEYMSYPRALALAEVLWSPVEMRDWESFTRRLPSALAELDRLGVRYRPLDRR
jgi:hexosaminidase